MLQMLIGITERSNILYETIPLCALYLIQYDYFLTSVRSFCCCCRNECYKQHNVHHCIILCEGICIETSAKRFDTGCFWMAHVEFGNALKHNEKEESFHPNDYDDNINTHFRCPFCNGQSYLLSLANRFGKCPNFICESRTKQTAGRSAQKGHHII